MSKNKDTFTFLIVPSATSRITKLAISKQLVYGVSSALAVLLAFGVLGIFWMVRHEALSLKYSGAKQEIDKLRAQNDVYQDSYSKLKGQISFIEDQSKELAREAKMEPISDVDSKVGVGGPETVSTLDKAADELEHQVRVIGDRLRSDMLRVSSVPSGLPVMGYLTDGFGIRRNPFTGEGGHEFHEGLDLAVDFGTPVKGTADGVVIWAGPYSGYGNLVAIYHTNGITTRYGHLSRITVELGQRVRRGDQIGNAGSTGRSTGPHVHYEVRVNDQPVDPNRYIAQAR
jgi:murein DD-endopeptidase MepM/ murein hydrolase activator NlpD